LGKGCGSVGSAVTSQTSGLQFDSSHWQKFKEHLFTVVSIEKTKIKEKNRGIAH